MRPRSWTDEDLIKAVARSKTYKEVVIALGLNPSSKRSQDRIRYRCNELKINRDHFGYSPNGKRNHKTNDELFVNGLQYSSTIRRRFLDLVQYECSNCGISDWQGKSISLQVEHKDGDQFNNELSNLTLLCPNCHSQTSTWGRQKSKRKTCLDLAQIQGENTLGLC